MKKRNLFLFGSTLLLAACGGQRAASSEPTPASSEPTPVSSEEAPKFTIGISQLVTHDALDAATNGFIAAVKEGLGEDNVVFDLQNAAGDIATCTTIANSFVAKKVDLIMANATPALQAAANATLSIPILGTSVTEYGTALEIPDFGGLVGGNISGTSDLAPLDEQAAMIAEVFPETKKVGLIYCSAEANSVYQVQTVSQELTRLGITPSSYSFSDSNDIAVVLQRAVKEVDLIYIPTDNTAASCAEIIDSICSPIKMPVVAGEENICRACGAITLSISYENLGRKTGEMAVSILKGESKIEEMRIAYDEHPVKKYNEANLENLGIAAPEGYVKID